ncbi:glycosyltransferase involved in cell wall biogenesis [Candidatus Vecturithrix granuli]|uniref:Glycosyltransferase involved in cell wall biogenesis n=1 Tax=Vecturithrix granuli TaxID=1499967 RepID=A0A081CAF6_VECG1|nr:glycosyltransferase involved in cell wall biogenesis [Candidatus Vecturithrix granuli]
MFAVYPFSCIIPALHEAEGINACLERLFRHVTPDICEVIVVDGDAEGSTIRQITYPNVVTFCALRGRGAQMNAGARQARGERLIFLHADTVLPANALVLVQETLAKPDFVAGAFTLRFDSPRMAFRLIELAASWRYRFTRLPYGDQAIFMTRAYFWKIGGFAEIPLMEDLDLMRRTKRRGDRICILPDAVTTSARRWEQEGVLYCVLRSWILASLFCAGVSPRTLSRYYRVWRVGAHHHTEEPV